MDINTEINKLITTLQKSLKDKLKERNQYIHNLQWEHHNQLEKYREEKKALINCYRKDIEELKQENEELKKQLQEESDNVQLLLSDKYNLTEKSNTFLEENKQLKKEINELKMKLGEPFVPCRLTAEQQVRQQHGLENYA